MPLLFVRRGNSGASGAATPVSQLDVMPTAAASARLPAARAARRTASTPSSADRTTSFAPPAGTASAASRRSASAASAFRTSRTRRPRPSRSTSIRASGATSSAPTRTTPRRCARCTPGRRSSSAAGGRRWRSPTNEARRAAARRRGSPRAARPRPAADRSAASRCERSHSAKERTPSAPASSHWNGSQPSTGPVPSRKSSGSPPQRSPAGCPGADTTRISSTPRAGAKSRPPDAPSAPTAKSAKIGSAARDADWWRLDAVVEAHPDAGHQARRVADEPGVAIVVGGAGLARQRTVEAERAHARRRCRGRRRRAAPRSAGRSARGPRRSRPRAAARGRSRRRRRARRPALRRSARQPRAASTRVGARHLDQRRLGRAEHEARHRVQRALDAEPARGTHDAARTDRLAEAHHRDVQRVLDRLAQGDGSAEGRVVVGGLPQTLGRVEREGLVVEQRGERETRKLAALRRERGQRGHRLEQAAGLAPGGARAIELAAAVVAPADQRVERAGVGSSATSAACSGESRRGASFGVRCSTRSMPSATARSARRWSRRSSVVSKRQPVARERDVGEALRRSRAAPVDEPARGGGRRPRLAHAERLGDGRGVAAASMRPCSSMRASTSSRRARASAGSRARLVEDRPAQHAREQRRLARAAAPRGAFRR